MPLSANLSHPMHYLLAAAVFTAGAGQQLRGVGLTPVCRLSGPLLQRLAQRGRHRAGQLHLAVRAGGGRSPRAQASAAFGTSGQSRTVASYKWLGGGSEKWSISSFFRTWKFYSVKFVTIRMSFFVCECKWMTNDCGRENIPDQTTVHI